MLTGASCDRLRNFARADFVRCAGRVDDIGATLIELRSIYNACVIL
jgi:hypothetical protein